MRHIIVLAALSAAAMALLLAGCSSPRTEGDVGLEATITAVVAEVQSTERAAMSTTLAGTMTLQEATGTSLLALTSRDAATPSLAMSPQPTASATATFTPLPVPSPTAVQVISLPRNVSGGLLPQGREDRSLPIHIIWRSQLVNFPSSIHRIAEWRGTGSAKWSAVLPDGLSVWTWEREPMAGILGAEFRVSIAGHDGSEARYPKTNQVETFYGDNEFSVAVGKFSQLAREFGPVTISIEAPQGVGWLVRAGQIRPEDRLAITATVERHATSVAQSTQEAARWSPVPTK